MFNVLLESHHVRPPRSVFATAVSTGLHTALVVVLVGGTTAAVSTDEFDPMWDKLARIILPDEKGGGVSGATAAFTGLSADGSPTGERNAEPVKVTPNALLGEAVRPQQVSVAIEVSDLERLQVAAQAVGAFTVIEVDSAAERDPLSVAPAYPKEMLAQNIEGAATMQFVVDSTGLIDMETVRVIAATHREFTQAVREAMPRMRFRPALRGTLAVRQLVEQPFKFAITLPTTTARVIKP